MSHPADPEKCWVCQTRNCQDGRHLSTPNPNPRPAEAETYGPWPVSDPTP